MTQRDILIRVYGRPNDTSAYPVDATLDDDSYFSGGELLIPEEELLKLDLDLQPYGARLGQCLFTEPILRGLKTAYATVSSEASSQMRLRLLIEPSASHLHAYPWERLLVEWEGASIPLAASTLVPFSRYIPLEQGRQDPIEERPIRMLLAVSNPIRLPFDLEHIDVEAQLRSLTAELSSIPDLQITVLPGRTPLSDEYTKELIESGCNILAGPTKLTALMEAAGGNHIVHLLSHGTFRGTSKSTSKGSTASLFLEGDDGDCDIVDDTAIAGGIAKLAAKPKLIYLSACDSANQGDANITNQGDTGAKVARPMVGLAPKLIQAGVPAVIAMQTQVEIETARKLAASFYSKLMEYGEVDWALSEARSDISDGTEWWIPVLFLRLKNGRLFTTDPFRQAIDALLAKLPRQEDRFYLPLEAVSLKSRELIRDWERTALEQRTATDLWQSIQRFSSGLTVIAGNAGTGKSTMLGRLARATAVAGRDGKQAPRLLPVLVDMREYASARTVAGSRACNLIFESIRTVAPALTASKFEKLLAGQGGVIFQLLFDGIDELPDSVRQPAVIDIERVAHGSPHQFLLAIDCRLFEPSDEVRELLVIQPLSARKVKRFLTPENDSPDELRRGKLLNAIEYAGLFELAAMPWLLLHMLEQIERVMPRSRVMVLEDWVSMALYSAAPDGGRSRQARESLYALGWKMHSELRLSLTIDETFQVVREVRGQRDYNLEKLIDMLVDSGILGRVGEEAIRFAYPPLQGYCAACTLLNHPRQAQLIESVVATLGQPNRVVWWGRLLSVLSEMMPDPLPVLQPLVYSASLTQGEQLFVAAACLVEQERRSGPVDETGTAAAPVDGLVQALRQQICAALLWRTKRENEYRYTYRERAADALGLLRNKETVPWLIRLAMDRIRTEDGAPQFEYSQVRFAAIRALLRMRELVSDELLSTHRHASKLIAAWAEGDLKTLALLLDDEDEGIQGAAAFALGDLQTTDSAKMLYDAFQRDPAPNLATLWAIADAVTALEPTEVLQNLIQPWLREVNPPPPSPASPLPEGALYERLIFLTGELRTQDPSALAFVNRYLREPVAAHLTGRALVALGKLHALDTAVLEAVIHGDFEGISAVGDLNPKFLQRKAIEAAGELGDIGLLYRARQSQTWDPELDEAFFHAAEACLTAPGKKAIDRDGHESGGWLNGSK